MRAAKRKSGTPALSEARARMHDAAEALALASDAIQKAADALPGARGGLMAIHGWLARVASDFDERVARPFDHAILEELLHQPVAPRPGPTATTTARKES